VTNGLSAYTVVYLVSAAVASLAVVFAWVRRTSPGGVWLVFTLAAGIVWSAGDALESSASTLAGHILWTQVSYAGSFSIGVFLLLFAIEYSGRPSLRPVVVGALLAVPALAVIAAFTNPLHHLIWTGFAQAPGVPNLVVYDHGWLYWGFTAYAYGVVLAAMAMLASFALKNRNMYRYQSIAILVAVAIPLCSEIFYDVAPNAVPGIDPSVMLSLSAVILTISMVQFRLLDLSPVAHQTLAEHLDDALLVLDAKHRLVEANPKAVNLFCIVQEHWVGEPAREVLAKWPQLVDLIASAGEDGQAQVLSPEGRHFMLTHNAICDDAGRSTGWVAVLRDVTRFVETETALEDANRRLSERLGEIEVLHKELLERAVRDSLTGLYNRGYLSERVEQEFGRAQREGYPVSVIMLDVDYFKNVNDTHGHASGDHVLRFIAAELHSRVRPGDFACRYGGDEFVLVLPNTSLEVATSRAEQWRISMHEPNMYWAEWAEPTTVSLGIAAFPAHGTSVDEIMSCADAAVYAAKAQGRDRAVVAPVPDRIGARA